MGILAITTLDTSLNAIAKGESGWRYQIQKCEACYNPIAGLFRNNVAVRNGWVLLIEKFFKEINMARSAKHAADGEPVIIKKYANRRLYNTQSSKYITLDFLADLTKNNVEFQVIDAKSGGDITHNVLTQIIMEEESTGQTMLPVGFLRQLISLYGDSMQSMVPGFLESSMDNFRKNQKKVENAIETAITSGPFGDIAKQNIEFVKAARNALIPALAGKHEKPDDIASLKKQMAELQAKIDALGQK